MDDPVIHARTKNVGVLSSARRSLILLLIGPTARASGLDMDVRRDDPYAAYDMVDWEVITDTEGDVFAKAKVRLLEMYESVSIIEQCLEGLKKEPEGDIDCKGEKHTCRNGNRSCGSSEGGSVPFCEIGWIQLA
jgi:membrane-bound hydrogenase subunit alpha